MDSDAETLPAQTAHVESDSVPDRVAPMRAGSMVGRYCILERIGTGAMGVVYAAYDPKLDRRVAIKLVRSAGADVPVSEILVEAQALAQLNHPAVVAVYDAGEHQGSVFMAMEFVVGQTLGSWREERQPSTREVVRVFRTAATGLAAAHDAGLIHRDFKPDNVMVAADGRVLVMDFGLALRGEAARGTTQTAGTPAYMSPEQFATQALDPRSDQFSFFVALYEALVGARPFDGATLSELSKAVLGGKFVHDPPLPDAPRWLRVVVLRGLSAEPDERYPSMHEAVRALDAGFGRRRRVVAGIGGAALTAAAAGAIWAVGAEERSCRRVAEAMVVEWKPAAVARVSEAFGNRLPRDGVATAERVAGRVDQFAGAWEQERDALCTARHSSRTVDRDTAATHSQCLENQRTYVDTLLAPVEDAEPAVLWEIASAAAELPVPADCQAASAEFGGSDDGERARGEEAGRALARAQALVARGHKVEAAEMLREQLSRLQGGHTPMTRARLGIDLARLEFEAGRLEDGRVVIREALADASRAGDAVLIADAWLERIDVVLLHEQDLERAAVLLEAVEAAVAAVADDAQYAARLESARGLLAMRGGHAVEAKALFESAIVESERGTPTLSLRVSMINRLAAAEFDLANYAAAKAQSRKRLELLIAAHGAFHPHVASARKNVGVACFRQDDFACARRELEQALATAPEGEPLRAEVLLNIGQLEHSMGNFAAARAAALKVIEYRKERFPGPHASQTSAHQLMVDTALSEGAFEEALNHARRIEAIADATTPLGHHTRALAQSSLGRALYGLGRTGEALAAHQRALEIRIQTPKSRPRSVAISRIETAKCLLQLGRYADAKKLAKAAIQFFAENSSPKDSYAAESRFVLARAVAPEDPAQAATLAREALHLLDAMGSSGEPLASEIRAWIASARG